MAKFSWKLVLVLVGLLASLGQGAPPDPEANAAGNWEFTVSAASLEAGAGSDLLSTYESDARAVLLTIRGTQGSNDDWRVDVRRVDTNWPSAFTLFVRRTGAGLGGGYVAGGSDYQAIGRSSDQFFFGSGHRNFVPLQFKLEGLSVRVPPDVYSTTIIYTVVDL